MKVWTATAAVLALFLALQTTILSSSAPKPDGVAAMTFAASFLGGPVFGAAAGFFGGLGEDALSGVSRGNFCLTATLLGWIFGLIFKRLYLDSFLFRFVGGALASAVYFFVFRQLALLRGLLSPETAPAFSFSWVAVEGALCALLVFMFQEWIVPEPIGLR